MDRCGSCFCFHFVLESGDIGSIGDFAASAEVAFGTILQRTYAAGRQLSTSSTRPFFAGQDLLQAVLGARMHYGHPDIMNKPRD